MTMKIDEAVRRAQDIGYDSQKFILRCTQKIIMTQNAQQEELNHWGDSFLVHGKPVEFTVYPRWWEFWKKPRVINLSQVLKDAQDRIAAEMINSNYLN